MDQARWSSTIRKILPVATALPEKSASVLPHSWGFDAYDPGQFHPFPPPDDDMETASTMLIAKPVHQVAEWVTDKQGRFDFLAVVHAIDVGPESRIAVVQELPSATLIVH